MPRRMVLTLAAFTAAGVLIPLALLLTWGAKMYAASAAAQQQFRHFAVFFWPTGMALNHSGVEIAPVSLGIATLVTIAENAALYALLGLFVASVWQLIRPDAAFDQAGSGRPFEPVQEETLTAGEGQ